MNILQRVIFGIKWNFSAAVFKKAYKDCIIDFGSALVCLLIGAFGILWFPFKFVFMPVFLLAYSPLVTAIFGEREDFVTLSIKIKNNERKSNDSD